MKNTIRRLTVLLLIAALMLSGCGGKETSVAGKVEPLPTTEPAVEDTPLSMGRIEGGIYTNDYAGFGCKLDNNWTYASAEELQDMPDDVQELVEGSELADNMDVYPQLFDMQAENVNDLVNMNVVYTKIPMKERLAYAVLSEEQELEQVMAQKDMLAESYAQAGITLQSMEIVTVNFLGEEHYAMYTVAETQDVPYYMVQLLNYDIGAYGVTLTISSFIEDKTGEVLDLFYKVG